MSRVLLASECLSGTPCRYHGRPDPRYRRRVERIAAELGADRIEWVCPEVLGGLPTPRPAGRRRKGRIWVDGIVGGTDLTPAFERGAAEAVAIAHRVKPCAIVLFAKSPSCDPESHIPHIAKAVSRRFPSLTLGAGRPSGVLP